jgi:fumarate hydratase class I
MSKPACLISEHDFVASIADALQYIAVYHPPSFVRALAEAYMTEESPAARDAIAQILINSKMAAYGRRPICQDTGTVNVFVKIGMGARIDCTRPLAELVNDAVRRAYTNPDNPLRASIIRDPLFDRTNTRDNTPAVVHFDMVAGDHVTVTVAAKGGGSENKAKFVNLDPAASVADWVVQTVETLGAGWCPPGLLGIGVGGSAEKAMAMAKEALLEPIDMSELLRRGPSSKLEEMRIEIYDRVNALGVGAQGLGGLTTVVDVKIRSFPCHSASKPVGLIPQCAADRHVTFSLDGSGPAQLTPPDLSLWPDLSMGDQAKAARRVNLDALTRADVATWRAGETLLLSGRMLTGRDAAHQRLVSMIKAGEPLPVDLRDRAIYYVGPVDAAPGEIVGPAGPTTSTRMDGFTDAMLAVSARRSEAAPTPESGS